MPSTPSFARALTALGVTIGSFATLQSLLVPVLPTMQHELHTSASGITWALTAWLITSAVATPVLGKVGDLVGRRRVILLALAAVALGSLVAALAGSLAVLLVGRVLQGIGGAMFPLAYGLVRESVPAHRVAGGVGALAALMAVGAGIGTVAAGPIADVVGWRGLFLIPLIGVSVGGALIVIGIPDTAERAEGRVNLGAAGLLSLALVALLVPVSTGGTWGWSSPIVVGLFAAAAVLFAAWVAVERRAAHPLVDMRMMSTPGVWNTNLAAALLGAAMFGVWAYLARFVQEPASTGYGLGVSVGMAGVLMLPMLVLMAAAGFVTGPLGRWVPFQAQVAAGAALIAASTVSIALAHGSRFDVAAAAGVFGFGLGIAYSAMTTVVVQAVPLHQTGVASGMNTNVRTIGSAVGTALMTAIVTGSAAATGEPSEAGYRVGFLVLACFAVAAGGAALLGRRGGAQAPAADPAAAEAVAVEVAA